MSVNVCTVCVAIFFQLVRDYLKETSMLLQMLRQKTQEEANKEAQLIFDLEKKLSLVWFLSFFIYLPWHVFGCDIYCTSVSFKCKSLVLVDFAPAVNALKLLFGAD